MCIYLKKIYDLLLLLSRADILFIELFTSVSQDK